MSQLTHKCIFVPLNRFPAKHLILRNLSVSRCACTIIRSRRFGKKRSWKRVRSVRILGRKCNFEDVNPHISKFPHVSTQPWNVHVVDTWRSPATFSVLWLAHTVLYSRHHPRVSRLPAGLKRVGTSFIALTADLETALQLSSSSFCLQSDVALISCLTITSAGIVVCTLSGPQEGTDAVFYSKTISTCNNSWRPKANFCLCTLVLWRGLGLCVMFHLHAADNDLWTNRCRPFREKSSVEGGGPAICRGGKLRVISTRVLWTQGLLSHLL